MCQAKVRKQMRGAYWEKEGVFFMLSSDDELQSKREDRK